MNKTFKRAFKYRIYPTKAQHSMLKETLDLCCELYNAAVEERREAWRTQRVSITLADQSRQLPDFKQVRPEFRSIHSQVLQQTLRRVDLAFKAFFIRCKSGQKPGYPRFKGLSRYTSLTWPQDIGFRLVGTKRLRLGGVGEVRIKLHRPLEGTSKTCTVKYEAGQWFAIFAAEGVPAKDLPVAIQEVGIDVGFESFATLSTGEKIGNPRYLRKQEDLLARQHQALQRKRVRSGRRRKAKLRLARTYQRIRNQRRDFQHKLAHRIVSEFSLIAIEDLPVRSFTAGGLPGFAKSAREVAWGEFFRILACKAEEAGRQLVKVPPRDTTRLCSRCGSLATVTLADREYRCVCGLVVDRDINASLNIVRLGRSLQRSHAEKPTHTVGVVTKVSKAPESARASA